MPALVTAMEEVFMVTQKDTEVDIGGMEGTVTSMVPANEVTDKEVTAMEVTVVEDKVDPGTATTINMTESRVDKQ